MARQWRAVTLNARGEVVACYGYFHDEIIARRIQRSFADRDVVVQYQQLPTIHPWVTAQGADA